ncbi:MAG: hypothetical protein ACPGWR_06415 [Ardenticatenaceae bacterium]
MSTANPFRPGRKITEPTHFFGRVEEVDTIIESLRSMTCVSLVADTQMGVSSLLYYIGNKGWEVNPISRNPADANRWTQALDGYELFYFDLGLGIDSDAKAFFQHVTQVVGATGETPLDIVHAIENRKVVLFLDEFNKTTSNPNFTSDFFTSLRGIAQTGHLALVTATKESLTELVKKKAITTDVGSPFYNIFPTELKLAPMSQQDAQDLLDNTAQLANVGVNFTREHLQWAADLAECGPYQLQLVGRDLFKAYQARSIDLKAIEKHFHHANREPAWRRWMRQHLTGALLMKLAALAILSVAIILLFKYVLIPHYWKDIVSGGIQSFVGVLVGSTLTAFLAWLFRRHTTTN